jgi:putative membrane protein
VVLWGWHVPRFYDAAARADALHALQHALFWFAGLGLWRAVLAPGRRRGLAIVVLFATSLHSTALGALLTFGSTPWYTTHLHTAAMWGLTPLEDQQLGGLLMWVPGGAVLTLAGLFLLAELIRRKPDPLALSAPGCAEWRRGAAKQTLHAE